MCRHPPSSTVFQSPRPSFNQHKPKVCPRIRYRLRANGSEGPPISDPTSVGTHFGKKDRATRELPAFQFELFAPLNRLVGWNRKPLNVPYAVASFLWFMTGDDSSDLICFYNERGRDFLESGRFCYAFGSRIHRSDSGNQTEQVTARLGSDPTSRRATITVFSPRDLLASLRDTPCLFGFQFFIRDGRLLCIGTMRSQSAALVMPYDIFVFTLLQEYVAVRLGQSLGSYIHTCHQQNSRAWTLGTGFSRFGGCNPRRRSRLISATPRGGPWRL